MNTISKDMRQALELRYDGPIPAQHTDTEQARRRRRRGALSVLESQAAQFLDAAERLQGDMEDVIADLSERRLARWQRDVSERQLNALHERCETHIRAAAEALQQAMPLRYELGLMPHPITAVADLLANAKRNQPV
jgi:hypothetical protein